MSKRKKIIWVTGLAILLLLISFSQTISYVLYTGWIGLSSRINEPKGSCLSNTFSMERNDYSIDCQVDIVNEGYYFFSLNFSAHRKDLIAYEKVKSSLNAKSPALSMQIVVKDKQEKTILDKSIDEFKVSGVGESLIRSDVAIFKLTPGAYTIKIINRNGMTKLIDIPTTLIFSPYQPS